jgi:hypothetical protein
MDEPDEDDVQAEERRVEWNTDPAADYPIGPDDAGNAVMHGVGLLVGGWRWFVGKLSNRTGAS